METVILAVFCALLLMCVVCNISILYALAVGLILFLFYGRRKGFSWFELIKEALYGIRDVRNILLIFILIGMLTALWRAAGTIPTIVCYAAQFIRPWCFVAMAFLMNCMVSVLTGTAFGTAATMGVICTAIADTMQIDPLFVGGAVLSGIYFGDRCSPVSTSALLIGELTSTNIFQNIRQMLRTGAVPFAAACLLYTLLGLTAPHAGVSVNLHEMFSRAFSLHWVTLLPAAVILILSLLHVHVKIVMLASIAVSLPICIFTQGVHIERLPHLLFLGYQTADIELAPMLNGGGIRSMLKVTAIVCLSSSYSGIFQKTGLLNGAKKIITDISQRTSPYFATLCTSVVSGMIACNQTLTIMLTHQLCADTETDPCRLAEYLENTAVVIAPMVPWSIAGAVPLAAIGASTSCIFFAFFLYLLPLWQLMARIHSNGRNMRYKHNRQS